MRIISPFHDYYDTAQGYGLDPKLIYRRELSVGQGPFPAPADRGGFRRIVWRRFNRDDPPYVEWALWHLAFCGHIYPLVVLDSLSRHEEEGRQFCWSPDDVTAALAPFRAEREVYEGRTRQWYRPFTKDRVRRFFEEVASGDNVDSFHRRVGTPIALSRTMDKPLDWAPAGNLILNPILKELEFFRVVDPFTAFQEISMYLGGFLGMPEKVHAPIPDDAMRDMKGFDERSFKTDSPGKKRRRREKKSGAGGDSL